MNTHDALKRRIRGKGGGAVFTPKDFLDLGSRAAIDQALSRLARDDFVTRLRRGVYYYPQTHPRLGILSPKPADVARALVGDGPLQPSGAAAANALGLSTQVPTRSVYYSDRTIADVPIGNSILSVRRAGPRTLAGADRPCGAVIQALRHVGRDSVDDRVIGSLRRRLPLSVRRDLQRYAHDHPRNVADWMRDPIERIAA